jgi:uncharacterized phage protein (TIGR02220 family)
MQVKHFFDECRYLLGKVEESSGIISLGHVGLYLFLNLHMAESFIYPELSKKTGISVRTLHEYIRILEELRLVERVSTNKGVAFRMVEGLHPSKIDYSKHIYSLTILNNTPKNTRESAKEDFSIHEKIINDLNSVSGRSFKLTATDTIKKISWLLKHDYKFEDFQKVHRAKLDWLELPKMQAYYRPKTLYAQENFESYLNERRTIDPAKATTSKWKAPERKQKVDERREKLRKRWEKHDVEE